MDTNNNISVGPSKRKAKHKKKRRPVKPAKAKLSAMVSPESLIALEDFRRRLPS